MLASDAVATDALAAVHHALATRPLSRDVVRAEAVRYGEAARDAGTTAREMTDTLTTSLGHALACLPASLATELRVHVAWWAAHGYHRAD